MTFQVELPGGAGGGLGIACEEWDYSQPGTGERRAQGWSRIEARAPLSSGTSLVRCQHEQS